MTDPTTEPTTLVVPTVGRPSLLALLEALASGPVRPTRQVCIVDDRRDPHTPLFAAAPPLPVRVLTSGGRGPAAARNLGWRHARTPWVSFLDDDVLPGPDWYACLLDDLAAAPSGLAGSQGRLRVPLPTTRRPTDWERTVSGLELGAWLTADMSYRRDVLAQVGGFDERFPRAFREDADLALRVLDRGYRLGLGQRVLTHPVRPADAWVSVRQQAGNADDMLMRRRHGPSWRRRAQSPAGRRSAHLVVTAAGVSGLALAAVGRRRAAALAGALWLAGTAEFAWIRIAPGPRDRREVLRMLATSAVIPAAATWHSAVGRVRHRKAGAWQGAPDAVLFDRDGTLVHDVPYNGRPDLVHPVLGAHEAVNRLRSNGIRVGLVSNQAGVGLGLITREQVDAVHERLQEQLGGFDTVQWCPHSPTDACGCRKPAPGLVVRACADLGVDPTRVVVVGDIGSDVRAAEAAGAAGILVPTPETSPDDQAGAARVERDLEAAVTSILGGRW